MELLNTVLHGVNTALVFLIVITVLVFVHELGHYLAARLFGIKVDAFAVMMGGVRKTDLAGHLGKKLAPGWILWATCGGVAVATFLAGFYGLQSALLGGLGFLAFVGPVWVVSRICALYHVGLWQGLTWLVYSWLGAAVVLGLGTSFRDVDPAYALTLFFGASAVAVMLTYYRPVLGGIETDGKKGFGQVDVGGEKVEVRFRPVWCRESKSGTEFSLLLLPLGGFASMAGMQPKADGSEVSVEGGFFSKHPLARIAVLFAGPLFSVLLGVVLVAGAILGQGAPVESTVIGAVVDGPAKSAGMLPGDRITSINGHKVEKFKDIIENVRFSYTESGEALVPVPLRVTFERGGESLERTVTPVISDEEIAIDTKDGVLSGDTKRVARLNIIAQQEWRPVGVGEALVLAASTPLEMVGSLQKVFGSVKTAQANIGGPGTSVQMTSDAVKSGFWSVTWFAGTLSIFLGIMNLLPFPPLDGGQMVIGFAELLRGNRRLPLKIQNALFTAGFTLVVLMMVFALTVDASRQGKPPLMGGQPVPEKAQK